MTRKLRTVVSHPHSFRLHPSPFVVAPSACGYAFPVQKRKVPACEGGLGGQRGRRNDTPNRRGSPRSLDLAREGAARARRDGTRATVRRLPRGDAKGQKPPHRVVGAPRAGFEPARGNPAVFETAALPD